MNSESGKAPQTASKYVTTSASASTDQDGSEIWNERKPRSWAIRDPLDDVAGRQPDRRRPSAWRRCRAARRRTPRPPAGTAPCRRRSPRRPSRTRRRAGSRRRGCGRPGGGTSASSSRSASSHGQSDADHHRARVARHRVLTVGCGGSAAGSRPASRRSLTICSAASTWSPASDSAELPRCAG